MASRRWPPDNPLNNIGGDQSMGIATADDFAGVGPGSGAQAWLFTKKPEVTGGYANNNGDASYWFNPFNADGTAIFTRPPAGTISNQKPRGLIYGPGFQNHNIRISKDFRFAERHSITFVAEAFNLLNHPNWNNPDTQPEQPDHDLREDHHQDQRAADSVCPSLSVLVAYPEPKNSDMACSVSRRLGRPFFVGKSMTFASEEE